MTRGYTLLESLLVLMLLVGMMGLTLAAIPHNLLFELEHKRLIAIIERVALHAQTKRVKASVSVTNNVVRTSLEDKPIRLNLRCTSATFTFTENGTIVVPIRMQCSGFGHQRTFGYSLGSGQYYE